LKQQKDLTIKAGRGLTCSQCHPAGKKHQPLFVSEERKIQRDRNAALNIRYCFLHMVEREGERPQYLTKLETSDEQQQQQS